jgi:ferredoxin
MKVTIDRSGCIGCGLCQQICPEVFLTSEDGKAQVYAQPQKENLAAAKEAEESCPVSVIRAEE